MKEVRHPLSTLVDAAARGTCPPPDGRVETLPQPPGPAMAVVAFTAQHVVATTAPEAWIRERLPDGDLLAPMSARFLFDLEGRLARRCNGVDVVLAARGRDGPTELVEATRDHHPRVVRARAHRDDVRVFTDTDAVATVVLGRGVALRQEVAIEVDPLMRGRGVGRRMLEQARSLVGAGGVLFAQTAPGNAASLRALPAAGFAPIGSEALFFA
jgi:GNAT superfamily N-acetyltransferase